MQNRAEFIRDLTAYLKTTAAIRAPHAGEQQ